MNSKYEGERRKAERKGGRRKHEGRSQKRRGSIAFAELFTSAFRLPPSAFQALTI